MNPEGPTLTLPSVARYQKDAIFCPERMAVIEATTKAGKTVGCLLWLLSEALNGGAPGREFWWAAPVYPQTEIAFRRMCQTLRATDPDQVIWKANQSDLFITLDNGSVLRFKTAEKPDNLYGEDVYAAVIDEASRCREESWHAIRSTLTATRGKLRIIGNVKGKKNWAFRLARRVQAGEMEGWKYAKITARDAVREGIIKAEEVEQARRELPEAVFKELYEAEASEDGSNPFGMAHIAGCVQLLSVGQAEVFGIDLAKSVDWTVVLGLDAQRRICFFDRWQKESWERTTAKIKEIVGHKPALADSTGVGDPIVETLAREFPNIEGFKFSSNSKQQIMEGLAMAIQKRETSVLEGVHRSELESFEYEATRTGVRYAAPEGLHDDTVCAHALAVERARSRIRFVGSWTTLMKSASESEAKNPDDLRRYYEEARSDPNFGFQDE